MRHHLKVLSSANFTTGDRREVAVVGDLVEMQTRWAVHLHTEARAADGVLGAVVRIWHVERHHAVRWWAAGIGR